MILKNNIHLTLGSKFISVIIIILSVTMSISAYYTYSENKDKTLHSLINKAKDNGKFVAEVSVEAILTNDYISLNKYMTSISLVEDVVYGVILSADEGRPLSSFLNKSNPYIDDAIKKVGVDNIKKITKEIDNNKNIDIAVFPIELAGEKIAELVIGIDHSRLEKVAKDEMFSQLIMNAIIIISLSLFIYIVFRVNALGPIKQLIKGSERIADGNLNEKVNIGSSDELGILAESFNQMMSQLKESIASSQYSMKQLKDLNKNLEDRVSERTAKLEMAQKIAHMGHWEIISDESTFSISSEVSSILGMQSEKPITLWRLARIIKKNDRRKLYKLLLRSIRSEKGFDTEFRIQRSDAVDRYLTVSAETKKNTDDKVLVVGIVQDITDRKLSENVAQEALTEKVDAESANQAKSAFLANMSHEIRTPLTAIIGFSESLIDSEQTKQQQDVSVRTILRNGVHLLNLINEILDLSKIESNKLEIEIIDVEFLQLIDDVYKLMSLQAKDKNLDFKIKYEYPIPKVIQTDPTRLKQILLNLCSNAIKFTSEGFVKVEIAFDNVQYKMRIAVIDSGIGVTKEQQDRLFKPFSQADSSTTRKFGGTGLGLYITRQLVNMMDGEIHIESVQGLGSRFSFNFSVGNISQSSFITQPVELQVNENAVEYSASDEPKLTGNILLAEDSPDNQHLIELLIKRTGAQMDIANNGKEAVEKALAGSYDLVLMDMQMPEMDGVQATEILRGAGFSRPIVALTANAMKEDRERCKAAGSVDFLTKPIDKAAFYSVLRKYLAYVPVDSNTNVKDNVVVDVDDAFLKLYTRFIESLDTRITSIVDALNESNWDDIKNECHRLKGIAGNFGFNDITQQAGCIEARIKNNEIEKLVRLIESLVTMCNNAKLQRYDPQRLSGLV